MTPETAAIIAAAASGASGIATIAFWLKLGSRLGRMEQQDEGFERNQSEIINRLTRLESWIMGRANIAGE